MSIKQKIKLYKSLDEPMFTDVIDAMNLTDQQYYTVLILLNRAFDRGAVSQFKS